MTGSGFEDYLDRLEQFFAIDVPLTDGRTYCRAKRKAQRYIYVIDWHENVYSALWTTATQKSKIIFELNLKIYICVL